MVYYSYPLDLYSCTLNYLLLKMTTSMKRVLNISKSIDNGYYEDLGKIGIMEESTLEIIKITCIPHEGCLLYTSPSPRDRTRSRMPSSA